MKKKFRSCDSQAPRSALAALTLAPLLFVTFASTTQAFAQRRLNRPPSGRELEGTPILPAGTTVIPDGTVLIIEMDTKLNSGTAQVSDRFLARIATPIVDEGGRTLLQSGTIIEGHVASVKKARWAHRSGELGLSFDYIEFGDGRRIPLRATLISGSNPIDEEGDLKAKSAAKRDVLVTTGGAVAGAGVGMLTGASILVGGGAGAAAGLTAVLIMKGKNVDVDPGERFNLQLVQPMSLTDYYDDYYRQGVGTRKTRRTRQITRPVSLQNRRTSTPSLITGFGPSGDPNSIRTQWSRIPVYDVRAERNRDGLLRILVTAETPTNGWRIYTNHEVRSRDTVDIRLMGIPPSGYGSRQISHPTAPAIRVEDRNSAIRSIIVRGRNGDKYLTIGQGVTSARLDPNLHYFQSNPRPPITQPIRPRPRSGPSDGSFGNLLPDTPSTGNISSLATQTANQVEFVRSNYAAAIGLWINSDGTIESLGGRRTTATETQLYDTLSYLLTSSRSLAASSSNAYNRQRAGQQLQRDTQTAQQMWQKVKSTGVISQDLDRQWQSTHGNLRSLSTVALR
jgi:opacity protein-like surface antigen